MRQMTFRLSGRPPRNVQNIYCNKPGKAHLLARINGATLEIYCVACKLWEPVSVVDIVRGTVVDMQNGHEPEQERRLLW